MTDQVLSAVVDIETGKPACVLLQAVYGGDRAVCQFFDAQDWILAPSPNFRMVSGTVEQWKQLAAKGASAVTYMHGRCSTEGCVQWME